MRVEFKSMKYSDLKPGDLFTFEVSYTGSPWLKVKSQVPQVFYNVTNGFIEPKSILSDYTVMKVTFVSEPESESPATAVIPVETYLNRYAVSIPGIRNPVSIAVALGYVGFVSYVYRDGHESTMLEKASEVTGVRFNVPK